MVKSGLCESLSKSRKLIEGKGVKLNDQTVETDDHITSQGDFNNDGILKLSVGKKNHVLFMCKKS